MDWLQVPAMGLILARDEKLKASSSLKHRHLPGKGGPSVDGMRPRVPQQEVGPGSNQGSEETRDTHTAQISDSQKGECIPRSCGFHSL